MNAPAPASPAAPPPRFVGRLAAVRLLEASARSALLTALVVAVYTETSSGIYVAALPLALYGLMMLLAPLSGTLIDRAGPLRTMRGSLLLEIPLVALLLASGAPLWLCGVAVLAFAAEAPFNAASTAYVADEVDGDEEALEDALGSVLVIHTIGIIVGPLLGGVSAELLGLSTTLVIIGAVLATAALVAFTLPVPARHLDDEEEELRLADTVAGFRFLAGHRLLRGLAIAMGVAWLAMGLVMPAEIAISDELSSAGVGYGLLLALTSLGSLAGSWHGTHFSAAGERRGLGLAMVALGIAFVGIGLAGSWWAVLALVPFVGYAEGVVTAVEQVAVAREAPEAVRGRAIAAMESVTTGGLVGALLVAGPLLDVIGFGAVFAVAGTIALVSVVALRPRPATAPVRQPG